MIVYKIDSLSYFAGEHLCQFDPVNGGFLYPAAGTYTKLKPTLLDGKWPKFFNEAWMYVTDNRGIWYNTETGNTVRIYDIEGDVTGLTKIPPPDKDYIWNGSTWVLKPLDQILNAYKEKQFKKINNYIYQNLCYIKKTKKLGDVTTVFDTKKNQTFSSEFDIDVACNDVLSDLFDTFDFNGGSL